MAAPATGGCRGRLREVLVSADGAQTRKGITVGDSPFRRRQGGLPASGASPAMRSAIPLDHRSVPARSRRDAGFGSARTRSAVSRSPTVPSA